MTAPTLTSGDIIKIKNLVSDGIKTFQDIDAHREGLKDMVKHVSDETNIPAKVLNKVVKLAYTGKFADVRDEFDAVESLLAVSGHGTGPATTAADDADADVADDNDSDAAGSSDSAMIGHNSKAKATK